jgi:hypothetical protein
MTAVVPACGHVVNADQRRIGRFELRHCGDDGLQFAAPSRSPPEDLSGRLDAMFARRRSTDARDIAQRQKPDHAIGLLSMWVPDNDLLSHGQSVLSSARRRFTVLFGMGRGGSGGL